MQHFTQRPLEIDAIVYDGTNADALLAAFGGSIDEDGSLLLPVDGEGSASAVWPGDAVFIDPLQGLRRLDAHTFALLWRPTV